MIFRDTFELKIRVHDHHSRKVIPSSGGRLKLDCLKKIMEFRFFFFEGGGQCKQESNV